jgi:hypothetical protein
VPVVGLQPLEVQSPPKHGTGRLEQTPVMGLQVSLVQGSPSLHGTLTLSQPIEPQESTVHALPSLHPAGTHAPAQQV